MYMSQVFATALQWHLGRAEVIPFLVLANVKPLANDAKKLYVQLQIKYQYVQFIGENSTGSGLNERLGNHHHTLKGQVIMYWK